MNTNAVSRQLAQDLAPGEHHLSNEQLRDIYGVSRITAKARRNIAEDLRRSGLEVLSDPSHEPLLVRKSVQRGAAVQRPGKPPWWRRRWAIALGVVALLFMIVGAISDNESKSQAQGAEEPAAAVSTTETQPAETVPVEPVATVADATQAVEDQDYAGALAIAAAISADDRHRIGHAISRHLAKRVRASLRRGDRSQAKRLLAEARDYPSTAGLRNARASYSAAKARAGYRAEQRRIAREAARAAAAERRAAERAAEEAAAAAAVAAAAPSVDSYDAPDTSGGSSTNWCGKRDGDGDGIYCEGE
jgi:hypothetical protein